ncbi:hypothetical protein [Embleya sp. NBC_00896]|uniref:hypothetical protein n=1 Tax=Embleya sp. NBC_00896 TaxID=2975961 RepID=UPI00386E45CF|nr:hypothetical protein OG928_31135 [Embleya sp. NBC_00896]
MITHAELVYRPGERALARRVLELLGCRVSDRGGAFFSAFVDPGVSDYRTNVLYASEVTPEQWAFEGTLGPGPERAAWRERLGRHPQTSCHFGIRVPELADLEAALAAIGGAGAGDPELAGRIEVLAVYRPGDPDAATDTMVQAFVRTDVLACGLLTLGQVVELQWHTP